MLRVAWSQNLGADPRCARVWISSGDMGRYRVGLAGCGDE